MKSEHKLKDTGKIISLLVEMGADWTYSEPYTNDLVRLYSELSPNIKTEWERNHAEATLPHLRLLLRIKAHATQDKAWVACVSGSKDWEDLERELNGTPSRSGASKRGPKTEAITFKRSQFRLLLEDIHNAKRLKPVVRDTAVSILDAVSTGKERIKIGGIVFEMPDMQRVKVRKLKNGTRSIDTPAPSTVKGAKPAKSKAHARA